MDFRNKRQTQYDQKRTYKNPWKIRAAVDYGSGGILAREQGRCSQ
jgi:hypothetical protein